MTTSWQSEHASQPVGHSCGWLSCLCACLRGCILVACSVFARFGGTRRLCMCWAGRTAALAPPSSCAVLRCWRDSRRSDDGGASFLGEVFEAVKGMVEGNRCALRCAMLCCAVLG